MAKCDEGQGFGIAILFGLLHNRLQFQTQTSVVSFEDDLPWEERNAKRLAEDRRNEEKERGDDAGGGDGESRFTHGTLLREKIPARRDGRAVAAWKNQGEQGVFGENTGAAERPEQSGPIPLHVIQLAEHAVSPVEGVVRRDPNSETQEETGNAAGVRYRNHARPPLNAGRQTLAAAEAAPGQLRNSSTPFGVWRDV